MLEVFVLCVLALIVAISLVGVIVAYIQKDRPIKPVDHRPCRDYDEAKDHD